MAIKRVAFRVYGSVQGVSFRDFTQRKATIYDVSGWVRNTADGKVEGEAQGEEDSVNRLLQDVNKGPRRAHVVKVEKNEVDTQEGEENFMIRI